jgi:hypothetical protein
VVCRFDVSAIPAGATVSSATLQFYASTRELNGTANDLQVYDLTQAWTEDGVTWRYRDIDSSQGWTGGGALGSLRDTLAFPVGTGWISIDVPKQLVESWINNGAVNFGILVKCSDESHTSTYPVKENFLRLVSSENTNTTLRPKLTVNYSTSSNIKPKARVSNDPAVVLTAGTTNSLTAEASDSDGTISSVAFYVDGSLLGTDTSSPFSVPWVVTPGYHSVYVVATDNDGGSTTSETETLRGGVVAYSANMNSNPGWTLESYWGYGTPSGVDGSTMDCYGEPAAGYTGSGVIGYRLSSPYYVDDNSPTNYATTPAIDCSGIENATLEFRCWLGATINWGGDARVQISTNGSSWSDVWVAGSGYSYHAGTWPLWTFDISAIADGSSTVYVRWRQRGGDNWWYAYCGWNLDDVRIIGDDPGPVILTIGTGSEGDLGEDTILTADPVGLGGTITNVEFYVDGELLGSDTTSPYEQTWRCNPLGTRTLIAIAYNDTGSTASSWPKTVEVSVPPIYSADMSSPPTGWTLDTGWAYGQPTGAGQDAYGLPDPTSGYDGLNVIGYRLDGDYEGGISPTRWAVTPSIDCSAYADVKLTFQRWLGVEGYFDNAYVDVSDDNFSSWTRLWENSNVNGINDDDGKWTYIEYDISSVADGQSNVKIRWGMGTTDGTWNFCGWNLDNVQVIGTCVNPDIDGDGLIDIWEQGYFGSLSAVNGGAAENYDSDPASNEDEFISGTDPDDPEDYLSVRIDGIGGDAVVSWPGITASSMYFGSSNRYYTLQSSSNLLGGSWSDIGPFTDVPAIDGQMFCTNAPTSPNCFYRVKATIAP